MTNRQTNQSPRSSRTGYRLGVAVAATGVALLLSACSNTAFESQPVDRSSSGADEDQATVDTTTEEDTAGEPEVLVVAADSPYDEPDIEAEMAPEDEGIPEDQAGEPAEEPEPVDPEESDNVAQVALGSGESAICATVQIGRDAVSDGADDLASTQQALLLDRVDLAADRELIDLLESIESDQPAEIAVLEAALDRCEDLGFEP